MSKKSSNNTGTNIFTLTKTESIVLLATTFTASFAVLNSEISLTRMFSVMFAYHYAFLAVAIAFAGLGLGGIFARFIFPGEPEKKMISGLVIVYVIFALALSLSTIITTSSPSPSVVFPSLLFFLSFLPAGIFLASAYRMFAGRNSLLYGADLTGAALGSLAPITFLNGLSPIVTILIVATALSASSILLALNSLKRKRVCILTAFITFLIASTLFLSVSLSKDVLIGNDQGKELYAYLNNSTFNASIVETKWNAFGRTDLVESKSDPHSKVIFIDGGAGTQVYHFDRDFSDTNGTTYPLRFSTVAYPFYFTPKKNTLVIGSGGGVEVLTGLMFNISHIHAVEINQETVDIVKEQSQFDGGIYTDYSNVHVHVDEGRSFLRRANMKFDVIMLNIPVTKTSQGSSGYSLAENYLFTTDSFRDFFNNLEDDGYLVIRAHERAEIYKLVLTALESLRSQGKNAQDIFSQFVVVEGTQHPMFPVLIMKKTPFTSAETAEMFAKSKDLRLNPVYFPFADANIDQTLDQALVFLAEGKMNANELITVASNSGVDIAPSTDDRPFFYKLENGLPFTLPQLLTGLIVLVALATFSYFIAWGRRIYLATKKTKRVLADKFSAFMPFYFASLGLGFMLIEESFIQKFILFVGSPTVAISIVLFSLLVSMGMGGLLSKKWEKHSKNLVLRACLIIGTIMVIYVLALPFAFSSFLSYSSSSRIAMTFLLTFPVGFLLGLPFPTGMRMLTEDFQSDDVAWMWGINGLYSLLGSTLAIVIAISYGFSVALLVGGAIYLSIFLAGRSHFKNYTQTQ